MSAIPKKTAAQIVGLGRAFVGGPGDGWSQGPAKMGLPGPPEGFMVTTEKGLAGVFPLSNEGDAIDKAEQLLSSPPQRGNFQRFVKVVKSTQQGGSQLLGQWLWSNYAWCHQGGPWTLNAPNCTGVMPPKPTYPAYGRGR